MVYYSATQDSSALNKAQTEVDRVLQGRPPSYEDTKELKFLTRCILESMRLYPHPPVRLFIDQVNYDIRRKEGKVWKLFIILLILFLS